MGDHTDGGGRRLPLHGNWDRLQQRYTFTLQVVRQNASGAVWECAVFDAKNDRSISIGKIFFVDTPVGLDPQVCQGSGRSNNPPTSGLGSYTFMEYFEQPRNYTSAATWSDFVATGPGGLSVRPNGIVAECCDRGDRVHGDDRLNGSSTTCLPPQCESPWILFTMGPYLQMPEAVMEQNPGCFPPPPPPTGCPDGQEFCHRVGKTQSWWLRHQQHELPTNAGTAGSWRPERCRVRGAVHEP